jgi:ParB-like chromosome segregation protein Spo0J
VTVGMRQGELMTELKVHPAAAVFPMLSDDELRDLAEDIKANGLIYPIVLDADGQLIDGRNRLAACNLAGVEPRFETLDGQDPVAYILSSNVSRRHMNAGQRAMAVAKLLETNNATQEQAAQWSGLKRPRIAYAQVVLQYAPEKADSVLAGALGLDEAYNEARARKGAASSMEAQMSRLRAEAPDLADLVTEERMTLREALAALDERIAEERRQREVTKRLMDQVLGFLSAGAMTPGELAEGIVRKLGRPDDPRAFGREVGRAIETLVGVQHLTSEED